MLAFIGRVSRRPAGSRPGAATVGLYSSPKLVRIVSRICSSVNVVRLEDTRFLPLEEGLLHRARHLFLQGTLAKASSRHLGQSGERN